MKLGMSLEELLELATEEDFTLGKRESFPKGRLEDLFRKGVKLLKEKNFLLAAAHFLAVTLLDPFHVKAWNNLGIAYYHLGRPKEAIEAFEEALRLDPENEGARQNLALIKNTEGGGRKDG